MEFDVTVAAFFTANPKPTAALTSTGSPSSLLLPERHPSIARSLKNSCTRALFHVPMSLREFIFQPNAVRVMETGIGSRRKPRIEQPVVRKRQTIPFSCEDTSDIKGYIGSDTGIGHEQDIRDPDSDCALGRRTLAVYCRAASGRWVYLTWF